MLAKRRLDLGFGRARSASTSLNRYLLLSNPESAARRSMAATFSDGMRNETTSVIRICLQWSTCAVKEGGSPSAGAPVASACKFASLF